MCLTLHFFIHVGGEESMTYDGREMKYDKDRGWDLKDLNFIHETHKKGRNQARYAIVLI